MRLVAKARLPHSQQQLISLKPSHSGGNSRTPFSRRDRWQNTLARDFARGVSGWRCLVVTLQAGLLRAMIAAAMCWWRVRAALSGTRYWPAPRGYLRILVLAIHLGTRTWRCEIVSVRVLVTTSARTARFGATDAFIDMLDLGAIGFNDEQEVNGPDAALTGRRYGDGAGRSREVLEGLSNLHRFQGVCHQYAD
jgi:hypothetical protein